MVLVFIFNICQKAAARGEQAKILDVGCGSGYLLGAFARIHNSKVIGVEHIKELYQMSKENFKVTVYLNFYLNSDSSVCFALLTVFEYVSEILAIFRTH